MLLQWDFSESICSCHFTNICKAVLTAEAFWRSGSFFFPPWHRPFLDSNS